MKPHKWAKEIIAWANGAEIEQRCHAPSIKEIIWSDWEQFDGDWTEEKHWEYRIKPQPKENESAHIPYWLCCGSLDPHHHKTFCSEAKAGYPERCRFGTAAEHQKRMGKPQPKEPQPKRFVCNCGKCNFEIKQEDKNIQPREPQYLYVYRISTNGQIEYRIYHDKDACGALLGKIKLET